MLVVVVVVVAVVAVVAVVTVVVVVVVVAVAVDETVMGKDHDLVIAAKTGNLNAVEKILVQKAKRTGPLAR